jgi:hypothetical protein
VRTEREIIVVSIGSTRSHLANRASSGTPGGGLLPNGAPVRVAERPVDRRPPSKR